MERGAIISMKSAKILALLRGPGIRFEPINARAATVYWQPSYDYRIQAQARAPEFPDRDANAIFRKLDYPTARGTLGISRTKTGTMLREKSRAARRRGVR